MGSAAKRFMVGALSSQTCPQCDVNVASHVDECGAWRNCAPLTPMEIKMKGMRGTTTKGKTITCPHCGEELVFDCERSLFQEPGTWEIHLKYSETTSSAVRPGSVMECPYCSEPIRISDVTLTIQAALDTP